MSELEQPSVEMPVDADVLATLVASHRRFLAFLERRVESRDAAEEILQAALAKAVEKAGELRHSESSVAWFFRLLRNAVIDHYRRRTAHERWLEVSAADPTLSGPVDDELHGEVCACFAALIPTLNPDYAHVLRAVDLDGRTVSDLAAELGITPNNAGVRLHRARQALRRRLQQTCSTCADHGCLDCTCGTGAH